ncbi:MAG: PTS sugar transporter subunit IIA [Kiritimatiellae bacterium]|nr:PTS sugar transporter subunit IIA [Kiritimatiellia bacterium]
MRLRDLLDESVVKVNLESVDKEECFEEMIDLLVRAGRVTDRAAALAAVRERETAGSTGIGNGCAVPHGKHSSIPSLRVALGTSPRGIDYDAVDGAPVRMVFMILASGNEPGPHIQALAEVVRLLKTPGFCRRVVEAKSAKDVLDVLDAEE